MSRFVIAGTDTDVGKTVFAAALANALGAHYWKPVQAGLYEPTDSEKVCALGVPRQRILPEAYRLRTPCSPHLSARIDRVTIDAGKLGIPRDCEALVVESAGGVLVPLTEDLLYADVFARWDLPVILVASTRLGTINHSLLSLEALRTRGVPVYGVAFVGDDSSDAEASIASIGQVRRLGRLPRLPQLNADHLREAFADSFELCDFA